MKMRSTALLDYKACPQKGYYKYNLGLRAKGDGKKSADLAFGTMIHEAVRAEHLGESGEELINTFALPPHKYKTKETAKVLLKEFKKTIDGVLEIDLSEKPFSFDVGKHKWIGRFDIVGKLKSSKYILEIKTSNPFYFMTKPNDQLMAYYIGGMLSYGVDGICLVSFDVMKLSVTIQPVRYSQKEVGNWLVETARFLDILEEGNFYKNSTACNNFGRRCEYHSLCASEIPPEKLFETDENLVNMKW